MNETRILNTEVLKACDIRGIFGAELNETDAYFIGRSYGTMLRRKELYSCVLGYDGRLSSLSLSECLIRGLIESGINVINTGLVPTPLVYFALHHLDADAGVIITASHNPPEYNGFKFLTQEGPFHGESIQELGRLCGKGDFTNGRGSLENRNLTNEYVHYLETFLERPFQKELSVVWDPGNGAAAAVLAPFLKILPGHHISICNTVDGTFPNHHPDPSLEENMIHLRNAVLENGADLGIAFDGDGDRIGVVDSEGVIIPGDQLLVLYARDLLGRTPAATVMSEVKASRFFHDDVTARGGTPLIWKVGHTNQKEKMKELNILLAGETSGHMFFADNHGLDDAFFSAVKLLNILSGNSESLAEIRGAFPLFYDSGEIRLPLETSQRKQLIQDISFRLTEEGRDYLDIDGIRTDCADGFWMLRSSNTQPHITIRCEAASEEGLDLCLSDLYRQLEFSRNFYQ